MGRASMGQGSIPPYSFVTKKIENKKLLSAKKT
jgi:hypothetical protein